MNPLQKFELQMTRRQLLHRGRGCLGAAALASLLSQSRSANAEPASRSSSNPGLPELPHFPPTAKRVIYLFLAGGPSHIDMFDYKPAMEKLHGTELPDSIRNGQRLTGMSSGQKTFPCVSPMFKFKQFGEQGPWINSLDAPAWDHGSAMASAAPTKICQRM